MAPSRLIEAVFYIEEKRVSKNLSHQHNNNGYRHFSKKGEKKMDKYVCQACGYIYGPVKGDPKNGIKPGTRFGDLPEDWSCPVCGAPKDMFEKES